MDSKENGCRHRTTSARRAQISSRPGRTTGIFYFSAPNENFVKHNDFRAAGVEEAKKYFRRKGYELKFLG
jgi:hypothetical protein